MRWWLKTWMSVHLTVLATTDNQKKKQKNNRQSFGCIHTKPTKIQIDFLFIENETTPWFVLFLNFSSTWSLDQLFWDRPHHPAAAKHISEWSDTNMITVNYTTQCHTKNPVCSVMARASPEICLASTLSSVCDLQINPSCLPQFSDGLRRSALIDCWLFAAMICCCRTVNCNICLLCHEESLT